METYSVKMVYVASLYQSDARDVMSTSIYFVSSRSWKTHFFSFNPLGIWSSFGDVDAIIAHQFKVLPTAAILLGSCLTICFDVFETGMKSL